MDTKDPTQKVFKTKDLNILRRWRKALKFRYTNLLQDYSTKFVVTWRDKDYEKNDISVKDLRSTVLPDNLALSFVQISVDNEKLITVTVYFKLDRRQGGSCLVQGHKCQNWVHTEYHQLLKMVEELKVRELDDVNLSTVHVRQLAIAYDYSSEADKAQALPPPVPRSPVTAVATSTPAGPALHTPDTPHAPPRRSRGVSNDHCVQRSLLALLDEQLSDVMGADASSTLPPLALPAPPVANSPVWVQGGPQEDCTPSTTSTNQRDRSSPLDHPVSPVPLDWSDHNEPEAVTVNVTSCLPPSLSASVTHTGSEEDILSPGSPPVATKSAAPVTLRNESSQTDTPTIPSTNRGPPPLREIVATAHHGRLLAQTLHAISVLNTTVQALTQELSDTRQKLNATTLDVQRLEETSRDTAVKATNTCKVSDRELFSVRNKLHSLEVRVTKLTSARKTQGSTIRDIKKRVKKMSMPPTTTITVDTPTDTLPLSGSTQTETTPIVMPKTTTAGNHIPVIVTSNRGDTIHQNHVALKDHQPLSYGHNRAPAKRPVTLADHKHRGQDPITRDCQPRVKYPNRVPAGTREYYQPPDDRPSYVPASRRPTPAQNLSTRHVLDSTDHLIIGDSVLRRMQGRKMVCTHGERVQIISVSGMSTEDLMGWLASQPEAHHVDAVTVHVGVNDCKRREVSSRQWDHLLKECWRVFPKAKLTFSTILPPKVANSKLNFPITVSNANLTCSCRKLGATLIDNAGTFAPNGRPLLELYRHGKDDLVHPSHKGMICLAKNIRQARRTASDREEEEQDTELSQDISRRLTELRGASDIRDQHGSDSGVTELRGASDIRDQYGSDSGSDSPPLATKQEHHSSHPNRPASMSRYAHSSYMQYPWWPYGMGAHMPYGLSQNCVYTPNNRVVPSHYGHQSFVY